jgi:phage shock protein C
LKINGRLDLARVVLRDLHPADQPLRHRSRSMQSPQPSLPMRDDNLLGICQALGDDFGFNPLWLRIAFACFLIWNPEIVVGVYLGLGLVVAFSRWLVPNPRTAPTDEPAGILRADNSDQAALAVAA